MTTDEIEARERGASLIVAWGAIGFLGLVGQIGGLPALFCLWSMALPVGLLMSHSAYKEHEALSDDQDEERQ